MKKYLRMLGITIFSLALVFTAQARTVNVIDFGVIPDDGEDDSEALNSAVDDLITGGGGTLVFPSGTIDLQRGVMFSPELMMNFRLIGDKGSIIKLNGNQNVNYFVIEKAIQFEMENLNFVAAHSTDINTQNVVWVKEAVFAGVKGSGFFGIGAEKSVVKIENSNVSIDNTVFCGSGSRGSILQIVNSKGLRITKAEFRKNGSLLGTDYTKGVTLAPIEWISVTNPSTGAGAFGQGTISITDSFFDDAARSGVVITNQKTFEVSGSTFFVSSLKGASGVMLNNVSYGDINTTTFNGTSTPREAIILRSNSFADINAITLNNIGFISRDANSRANIRYCPSCPSL